MVKMNLTVDEDWFVKRSLMEGELEINNRCTMSLNLTPSEMVELERLQFEALPQWAREKIECLEAEIRALKTPTGD